VIKGQSNKDMALNEMATLALLSPLLPKEAGLLKYQDLSFKINLPFKKAGTSTIWGFGALDYQGREAIMDSSQWETSEDRKELKADLFMGVFGITHKYLFGKRNLLTSILAWSGNGITWIQKRLDSNYSFQTKKRGDHHANGCIGHSQFEL
jgi:hypothetical protein